MGIHGVSSRRLLTVVVLLHLAVSIVHGAAHTGAHVALSQAQSAFVFVVILIGPLAGLVLTWPARHLGSRVIAITLAGSFVFGLVNHFLIQGDDHILHVDPQWRALFTVSAILLAGLELLGCGIAVATMRASREAIR